MTLWERVEDLARRVGEVEAQPRFTLDGEGELAQRIKALEVTLHGLAESCVRAHAELEARMTTVECSCDGGFDPSEKPPHDHAPCGGTGRLVIQLDDAPIGALDAIGGDPVALPDPVTLKEATELLGQWATWRKGPLNRTKDFLARARVAPEKP
jgi:hypothetical protein